MSLDNPHESFHHWIHIYQTLDTNRPQLASLVEEMFKQNPWRFGATNVQAKPIKSCFSSFILEFSQHLKHIQKYGQTQLQTSSPIVDHPTSNPRFIINLDCSRGCPHIFVQWTIFSIASLNGGFSVGRVQHHQQIMPKRHPNSLWEGVNKPQVQQLQVQSQSRC